MSEIEDKYISLLTDFGFKRIFGPDLNKDLLISFLNALFEGSHVITDVKYLNTAHLGDIHPERQAVLDVYCETENGIVAVVFQIIYSLIALIGGILWLSLHQKGQSYE